MFKHPLWEKLKPWIVLSTYILVLLTALLNFKTVSEHLLWVISLFNPLLYGIAIAYVLNQPMKHIEKFLRSHMNPKGYLITVSYTHLNELLPCCCRSSSDLEHNNLDHFC